MRIGVRGERLFVLSPIPPKLGDNGEQVFSEQVFVLPVNPIDLGDYPEQVFDVQVFARGS